MSKFISCIICRIYMLTYMYVNSDRIMWKQKTLPMETTLLPWALRRGWEEKYGVLKYFQLLLTGYLREHSTDQRCSVPGAVVKAWGRTVVAAFDQLWFIFATENCIYSNWNHSVCGWKEKDVDILSMICRRYQEKEWNRKYHYWQLWRDM